VNSFHLCPNRNRNHNTRSIPVLCSICGLDEVHHCSVRSFPCFLINSSGSGAGWSFCGITGRILRDKVYEFKPNTKGNVLQTCISISPAQVSLHESILPLVNTGALWQFMARYNWTPFCFRDLDPILNSFFQRKSRAASIPFFVTLAISSKSFSVRESPFSLLCFYGFIGQFHKWPNTFLIFGWMSTNLTLPRASSISYGSRIIELKTESS